MTLVFQNFLLTPDPTAGFGPLLAAAASGPGATADIQGVVNGQGITVHCSIAQFDTENISGITANDDGTYAMQLFAQAVNEAQACQDAFNAGTLPTSSGAVITSCGGDDVLQFPSFDLSEMQAAGN